MSRIAKAGLTLIILNEIRGIIVVATIGWPMLKTAWGW